jgi:hypothetical protein
MLWCPVSLVHVAADVRRLERSEGEQRKPSPKGHAPGGGISFVCFWCFVVASEYVIPADADEPNVSDFFPKP